MTENSKTALKAFIAIAMAAVFCLSACRAGGGKESASSADETLSLVNTHYAAKAGTVEKRENVYVNINNDGSVAELTVSDWLHADRNEVSVDDVSRLKNIKIVRGAASYQNTADGAVTWELADSDVYYEGTSADTLPVTFDIKYFLDDEEISAKDLAGKSGRVTISISMQNNVSKMADINGKSETIFSPFVVLGGMIMPYENFSEISVNNGMTVGGGSKEVIVFTGAPGLAQSLDAEGTGISALEDYGNISFDDTFTVSAKAENFALGDMYFVAVPLTSVGLDLEMPESVEDVRDLVEKIRNVSAYIDTIDPDGVLGSYVTDSGKFKEVFTQLQTAVTLYQNNKELISAFTSVMTPENVKKLTDLMDTLDTDEVKTMLELLTNLSSLTSLLSTVNGISDKLNQAQPVLDELDEKLSDPTVAAQVEKLPETMEQLKALTDYMEENKQTLDIIAQLTNSSDMQDLIDALDGLIAEENAGTADRDALNPDVPAIVARMTEVLKFNYGIYSGAAEDMTTSCMFIYKADPIK